VPQDALVDRPTVLVADDDASQAALLRGLLSREGYEVLVARDGEEALSLAMSDRADLLLLDVMMPGLTGFEVCRKVKTNPETYFVPVVLMTALDSSEAKAEGLEAGADEFLNKPVDLHELKLRVKTLVRAKSIYVRFREAYKMQALSHLAAGVAHNLKNIMNGLLLNLELARPDVAPGVGEMVDTADAAGRRVVEIIDLLMLFARTEPMHRGIVDLCTMANDVAGVCRSAFGDEIEISVDAGVEEAMVEADLAQLKQAVLNLMFNARDAVNERSTDGPRRIQVGVYSADEAWHTVSVTDNGVGMAEETKRRLFEPFYTTKPNDGGIGLGLATVRDVVQQHQGTIDVETRQGEGTAFTLRLPAA
jgi:signal transduction histidine kinase